MRSLTFDECALVNGGYQHNFSDAMMVSGAFASVFSVVGAAAGVASLVGNAHEAVVSFSYIFVKADGVAQITYPIAMFAGIGFFAVLGAIVGFGLYYIGAVTKLEQQ